jgi:CDP-archaeol synthase
VNRAARSTVGARWESLAAKILGRRVAPEFLHRRHGARDRRARGERSRLLHRRRVLGDHKTVRGAVVMAGATAAFSGAQAAFGSCWPPVRALGFDHGTHWLPWGLLLGIGYVVGELPNSCVKRQLDVAPGASAPGLLAPLFWPADQLDSLVGVLCLMALVWVPPLAVAAALTLLTLAVHPAMALVMVALGLKRRVG